MGLASANGIISGHIERLERMNRKAEGDFEKDGIIYCGVCGEKKQAWIDWLKDEDGNDVRRLMPVSCKCEQEKFEADLAEEKRRKFKKELDLARDKYGIQARNVGKQNFDMDDNPSSPISRTCREYVEKWKEMRENNMGILFYGNKGTGKTFYAASIVNALSDRQIPTAMTTTALLMSVMNGARDKADVIDNLNHFSLLVLDDLGAERDTAYGSEIMYNIIDGRYRSGKPLIVTTNIDIADMQREPDLWRSRIYDRIFEMCPIMLRVEGESRRKAIATERRDMARVFLANAARGKNDGPKTE